MPFKNPIVAGINLVRNAIRSPNYVAGSAGWTINKDGSAEFSNLVARGDVIVGTVPGPHVSILRSDSEVGQNPRINFETDDADESHPGVVGVFIDGSGASRRAALQMETPNLTDGQPAISMYSARADQSERESIVVRQFNSFAGLTAGALLWVWRNAWRVRIDGPVSDASLSSTQHPFQIGDTSSTNLILDDNEVLARNNGAESALFLNNNAAVAATPLVRAGNSPVINAAMIQSFAARASADLTLTTTIADVPSATVTFTTYNANAVVLVTGVWDFDVSAFTSGGVCVGELWVDGATVTGNAIWEMVAAADRGTPGQVYSVVLATAGSHTITMRAKKTGGTNTVASRISNTAMTLLVLDFPA